MRCHICNNALSPTEIQFNRDHKEWDPCSSCLEAINEVFNDDDETEIDAQLSFELGDDDVCEGEVQVGAEDTDS